MRGREPVIVSYARTPIGKYAGVLSGVRPDDLLAHAIAHAVKRAAIDPSEVSEVIAGCANQAGEDNRNIARMASLLSGLPLEASAITVNRLCASGLDAVIAGARRIICEEGHVVVVGGVESMSRAPYVMAKQEKPFSLGNPEIYDSSLGWRFFNPRMQPITPPEHNGVTAERLVQEFSISRARQDEFALHSHRKAVAAMENGMFAQEIVPVSVYGKKGTETLVEKDEGPRADTDLEKLSQLKPAFLKDGTVTAGNSSMLNDGAAALVITSREYAHAHGLKPLASIVNFASRGLDPKVMGLGPVYSTRVLMEKMNCSISDFDIIEVNEAFAAQVLAVLTSLSVDEQKVNLNGGAVALGHPLGCSGARITISLVNLLQRQKKELGLATLCVGVGQGVSMALKAV